MVSTLSQAAETRRRSWLPRSGPKTLAVLRIITGFLAFRIGLGFRGFGPPPEQLRVPPAGTAWLDFLPVNDALLNVAAAALAVGGFLLAIGWRPQLTATVAALGLFYAGWATTLTGKVDHSHHILWVLVILAVSPCANAWAVRGESRSGSYQWPAMAVIAIIGLIYFGAGLQKLTSAGFAWAWSDNLTNTMLNQAWEKNQAINGWLVEWPLTGRILAMGALLFELLFLPLILYPKIRRWVWPAGLLFHWGTWLILGISFLTLQAMYVVFFPLDRPGWTDPPTGVQRRLLVGLVAVVTVFAVSGVDLAWPFAAYPGFEGIQDHHITDYEVVVDGQTTLLSDATLPMPPWHVRPFLARNIKGGRASEVLEWLGTDEVYAVLIDTSTGEVVERRPLS